MTPSEQTPAEPQHELKKKIAIKVFGIGGAGCNAVSHIAPAEYQGCEFFGINTDVQALEVCPMTNKLVLGSKRTRGLGSGGDPDLGRVSASDDEARLRELCKGADMVFILAGLGGGTGTGASPILAKIAKESGALVMAVVTLPFEFEGSRRQRQAQLGLQQLKAEADAVLCLPNEKLCKLIDEKTTVVDAFKISNSLLAEGVRGIWRLLTSPGLINVDFADLCSVTRGRHAESSFASAEASGEQRVEQLLGRLMSHPLLDGGQVLNESDAVLVSIVGGADLTMAEVSRLMAQLNRNCENAHLILGAAIDPEFAGKLSVTLIASREAGEPVRISAPVAAAAVAETAAKESTQSAPAAPEFLNTQNTARPNSRFVPPAPTSLTHDEKSRVIHRQGKGSRKITARLQKELPLEVVTRGRFDKSEPTLRDGEDLDVPTYIRRGVALN